MNTAFLRSPLSEKTTRTKFGKQLRVSDVSVFIFQPPADLVHIFICMI